MKVAVVIAAGGNSTRMKIKNKLLINLLDTPIIVRTIRVFFNIPDIIDIVVVCNKNNIEQFRMLLSEYFDSKIKCVVGGKSRQQSVFNGIKQLNKNTNIVLIHDGARPFIREKDVMNIIEKTQQYKACCIGVKSKDTIKVVDNNNVIKETPERKYLYNVQTPQAFTYEIAYKIHNVAEKEKIEATDDSSLAEKMGYEVHMIEGSYNNIKITTQEDLQFANFLLLNR